jgi:O-methyltransferase involved in polyketide biosynthesis
MEHGYGDKMHKTESNRNGISDPEKPYSAVQTTNFIPAWCRGLSDIPNARKMSEAIHAEKAVEAYIRKGEDPETNRKAITSRAALYEARYKSVNALISLSGVSQVVEFAAGWTVRGLNSPNLNFVHTDLGAEVIDLVGKLVPLITDASTLQIHFVRFDAVTGEGMDEIMACLREEPVAVVHEGLLNYLPLEIKAKVAENVKKLLEAYGGVYITPDINYMRKMDPSGPDDPSKGWELSSFFFESSEEAKEFFAALGFTSEIHHMGEFFNDLSSLSALSVNPEEKKQIEDIMKDLEIMQMMLRTK